MFALLGGQARDRPVRDLAVRAREDRAERGAAATSSRASASTQRPRCASASCTRSPTISTRRVERSSASCSAPGPRRRGHAKRLVLDPPPTGWRPRAASPSAARATRARRACAPSWTSASRWAGRRSRAALEAAARSSARSSSSTRCSSRRSRRCCRSYADELGLSKAGAGLLAAAYPLGALVGGIPGGISRARFGVKPTVLVGLAVMAVTTVAFGFADSIWLLDAARFLQGLASSFSWTAALAWLVAAAPPERRGETDRRRDGRGDRRRAPRPGARRRSPR